jgi:SAM-dependent methyltransferase
MTTPLISEEIRYANVTAEEEIYKLAPFNPSSTQIQEKAMEHLFLTESDVLFDLGCGDGRMLVAAAKQTPGLRCIGVEMDPVYVARAIAAIELLPPDIQSRIEIREGDVLKLPVAPSTAKDSSQQVVTGKACRHLTLMDDATAIYLFILPKGVVKVMPLLDAVVQRRNQEGRYFRVLSYMFKIHDWGEPNTVDRTAKGDMPIYVYEFKSDKK